MTRKYLTVGVLLAALASFGAGAYPAAATSVGFDGWIATEPRTQAESREIAQRAEPLDREVAGSGKLDTHGNVSAQSSEPLAGLPGEPPSSTSYEVKGTIGRTDDQRSRQSHVPFQRTEITSPSAYPYVTHGRIFMEYQDGVGFCSGTIVPDQQESLVLTAAHCLIDEEGIVPEAILFAPGYRLGNAPYGYWDATEFAVTNEWATTAAAGRADERFDIGAIRIAPDSAGVTLGRAFGWRGIQFNNDWRQKFSSFGYPGDPPFDGERLYRCVSTAQHQNTDWFPSYPYPTGMGCDMTPGSSGGGWVIGDQFVNSLVSFSAPDHPNVQYGPYFGSSAQKFYEWASGYDLPDTQEPVEHRMSISLTLRRHLVAKGTVTSSDGYLPCTRNAPVAIFRKSSTGWGFLKETVTNADGRYKVRLRDKPGRYLAFTPLGEVDYLNMCSDAGSAVRRHSH